MTDDELKDKIKSIVKKILVALASFETGIYYDTIRDTLVSYLGEIVGLLY